MNYFVEESKAFNILPNLYIRTLCTLAREKKKEEELEYRVRFSLVGNCVVTEV